MADSLRKALGDGYHVRYPRLPNDGDTEYLALRAVIARELAGMTGQVIIVGHSAGGAVLMKYLSEEHIAHAIAGVFVIAAPYFGDGGWDVDDGALREGFAKRLPKRTPMFFY